MQRASAINFDAHSHFRSWGSHQRMPRAGIMQQPPPPSDQVMRTITGGFFFQVGVTLVAEKSF
jgi:hypothetical protein